MKADETEEELFVSLKTELKKVDYNLQRGDLVNFHRLGPVKKNDKGPDTRQVNNAIQQMGPTDCLGSLEGVIPAKTI